MNDNCITKVVVFRRIAMGSLVRRYIVTKGQVKPLLDACIIFPSLVYVYIKRDPLVDIVGKITKCLGQSP